MPQTFPKAMLLAAAALSAGCSSLLTSDAPAETVYWLEAAGKAPPGPRAGAPSLALRFIAAPGLDTDRLLVRRNGATVNSYEGARWADNLPEVLGAVFRTVLEDSGRFSRVSAASSGIQADQRLDLELHAFFAMADQPPPEIEMELRGYVLCGSETSPIRISSRTTAADNTLTSIAAGFQRAVDLSAASLLDQLDGACGP